MKCCGKPMDCVRGTKVSTDPLCRRGKAVRHAPMACTCTYRPLYVCRNCRRKVQDEQAEIAPRLLGNIFSV